MKTYRAERLVKVMWKLLYYSLVGINMKKYHKTSVNSYFSQMYQRPYGATLCVTVIVEVKG